MKYLLSVFKSVLLVVAMSLMVYTQTTPGAQVVESLIGGVCVGMFVILSEHKDG